MNTYSTRNQHVAVFCVYAGLILLEVKKIGPKSLVFVLDDPNNEGPELDREFYSGCTITSPRELLKVADEVRFAIREMYAQE